MPLSILEDKLDKDLTILMYRMTRVLHKKTLRRLGTKAMKKELHQGSRNPHHQDLLKSVKQLENSCPFSQDYRRHPSLVRLLTMKILEALALPSNSNFNSKFLIVEQVNRNAEIFHSTSLIG